ncbi:hypotheticalsprotein [Cercospora beticola]|uniref:Hypotheticalsprotein n=1 Tax=Cercospora beticola TaxID=122368 RepID=A0A2G5I1J8_CERBT|nr:hypotheticalsprotein [Cercospora beticola]PIA98392.1 hypotheticalsprotein [Cercospora beticola]WPA98696.1 hypothetical protein RHO25_003309 [Cercospora beticola]
MPPSKWSAINGASQPKEDPTTESFTITAPPKTDIWRRSDTDDVFNAPTLYQTLSAETFKSISVTVYAPWHMQYDQGGLILAFPSSATPKATENEIKKAEDEEPQNPVRPSKWVKAGIEFFELSSVLGIVGTDRFSDWSLAPMSQEYHQKARFKIEKKEKTLWVYARQEGEEKLKPMREIKWAFMEGRDEEDIWVGVYAAKPTPEEGEDDEKGIEVSFSDLELELEDES